MNDSRRQNDVLVRLSHSELARLDELPPGGTPRATFLRSLLRESPNEDEIATRAEVLAILSRLARDGRVAAAIALERALRDDSGDDLDDEDDLERILRGD
jgi:hypothetical protein